MVQLGLVLGLSLATPFVEAAVFNPLQWLGANRQWYPGPDVSGVSQEIPAGCAVDQVAIASRHGSRFPDPGAYNEWLALEAKVKNGTFSGPLEFLNDWHPVLTHPSDQIAQLSVTGYLETYSLGAQTRLRYPHLYADNTPFVVWANNAQRTTDSARLFARGFGGPNATTLGTVYVVNPKGAQAGGNSLATSDLCPKYVDTSGANQASPPKFFPSTAVWDSIYLPPILKRLQKYIKGVNITTSDISIMPYLCGFETQILGKLSPFCDIFTESEFKQYEYRQDLRYYYGTGPGTDLPSTLMLPYLNATSTLFLNGPGHTYSTGFTPPPIIVSYTHDNQLNELATAIGVFNTTGPLSPNKIQNDRLFISSRINPMAGRIAFERMTCTSKSKEGTYVRIRVNDAVYPMKECQSGPGKTCPLGQFGQVVKAKTEKAGDFVTRCGLSPNQTISNGQTTIFWDTTLPWISTSELAPYFSQVGKHEPGADRKRRHSGDQPTPRSTPARVATPQDEIRLTTSPYFSNARSPPLSLIAPHHDTQVQQENQEVRPLPRKRQRLALRGDTPDEPPPPPATPKELSRSLQSVKPSLVQEAVRDNPWKIIVATTLLNKTSGKVAIPVFWKLVNEWPTPISLAQAAAPNLTGMLRPLGTQSVRTSRLIRLSNAYAMHPPVLPSADESKSTRALSPAWGQGLDHSLTRRSSRQASSASNISTFSERTDNSPAQSRVSSLISSPVPTLAKTARPIQSPKEYNKAQKLSPIAHIPFTGPYAIDSFRIFSSSLPGGGAPHLVGRQLERIQTLLRSVRHPPVDDFDETPNWYDPEALRVLGDDDAEWRQVRPADKELRRYLVWRWAIEGVAYDAERHAFGLADWKFLNGLIRG